MNIKGYVKDKIIYIILLLFTVITCEILLMPFEIHIFIKIYIGLTPIICYLIGFIVEYFKKKRYYENLKDKIDDLNDKYLIAEIIETSDFLEGKVLKEILQEAGKSMLENVNRYKYLQEDYKEFIELWIHEIKLPISCRKIGYRK